MKTAMLVVAPLLIAACGGRSLSPGANPSVANSCGRQGDNDQCDAVSDCCPLPDGSTEQLVCVPASGQCCRVANGPNGMPWLNCAALPLNRSFTETAGTCGWNLNGPIFGSGVYSAGPDCSPPVASAEIFNLDMTVGGFTIHVDRPRAPADPGSAASVGFAVKMGTAECSLWTGSIVVNDAPNWTVTIDMTCLTIANLAVKGTLSGSGG